MSYSQFRSLLHLNETIGNGIKDMADEYNDLEQATIREKDFTIDGEKGVRFILNNGDLEAALPISDASRRLKNEIKRATENGSFRFSDGMEKVIEGFYGPKKNVLIIGGDETVRAADGRGGDISLEYGLKEKLIPEPMKNSRDCYEMEKMLSDKYGHSGAFWIRSQKSMRSCSWDKAQNKIIP